MGAGASGSAPAMPLNAPPADTTKAAAKITALIGFMKTQRTGYGGMVGPTRGEVCIAGTRRRDLWHSSRCWSRRHLIPMHPTWPTSFPRSSPRWGRPDSRHGSRGPDRSGAHAFC